MFLTPTTHAFNWKQSPRLAIGLAFLLAIIFILWHPADKAREHALQTQYTQELLPVEWPLYDTHLLKNGRHSALEMLKAAKAKGDTGVLAAYIGADDEFVDSIRLQGKDYLPDDVLSKWANSRQQFDEQHKRLAAEALGVDPEHFRLITFLTFNLVQPNAIQFIGVILLLLTAGMALELALGGGAVLVSFLGSGVIGAIAYLIVTGNGVLPLVGAGAGVGGVVGMFVIHFRRQSLTYFGSTALSALLIPLLWAIFMVAQYFLTAPRLAELVAQIVGLTSAPLWYFIYQRWFYRDADTQEVVPEETETDLDLVYREQLQLALDAVGRMEFVEAQKRLRELVKAYPQDLRVLAQLYHVEKLNPESTSYDAVSRRFFLLSTQREDGAYVALPIYRDYEKLSLEKRALDTEVSLKLVMRFARVGEVKDAEKILKTVVARNAKHPLLAKAALALAQAFEHLHDPARAEQYRDLANAS
jgi:membrane associated rhomboid family serine protease